MTTASNQAKIAKIPSADSPNQRLLRTHREAVDDDDSSEDSSEERTISISQMKAIVEELGIDWKMVQASSTYLQQHAKYEQYQEKANALMKAKTKSHGSPRITREENF
ncbi:Avr1b-1 avirulence-like protein [Phytophthora cinnamomi]|uniref:Avr1b-1 avirulence-like protein n=1 Tax=Phytophthora cinnamomi TaxID=4785 RepID=UPI003559F68B|nr:Avr1b-1 avirulence-like protein [Phytophthora cinnamomi]